MTTKTDGNGHSPIGIPTDRTRWFYGQRIGPQEMARDGEYLRSRLELQNRLFHGQGVVCGLDVRSHPRPECADTHVVITAGLAFDCRGRHLIWPATKAVRLDPSKPCGGCGGHVDPDPCGPPPAKEETGETVRRWVLCLRLCEAEVELVPALVPGGCDAKRREANRIRESAELVLLDAAKVPEGCWPNNVPDDDCLPCAGCGGDADLACLEPDCRCGDCVAIAVVTLEPGCPVAIETAGRPSVLPQRDALTRIRHISWTHAGEMTLDELKNDGGRLVVTVDREIATPASGEAWGVNEQTFVVQYSETQEALEFVEPAAPPEVDGCAITFTIDDDYFGPRRRRSLPGSLVFVTLRCDFILDCNGRPVDGNHLGGRLPSGDGVAGGTFESWFRIV